MRTFTRSITPALLVLLFTYAAASKLADINRFRGQLYLQPFSRAFSDMLLYLLPVLELLTVALIIFGKTRLIGLAASLALLTGFTIYISMGLLHVWKRVPCSCGGIFEHMGWGTHLAFNWAFIIINVLAIVYHRREETKLS